MNKSWFLPPLHPAGWPFIGIAALVAVFLSFFGGVALLIGLLLVVAVALFFRDPVRMTPTRAGLIISPADGRIVAISQVTPDKDLGLGDETHTRISIFLSVLDVHINRSPVDGEVVDAHYRAGKFFNAALDKASVDNERNALALTMEGEHPFKGRKVGVVQIAGLIARRIICTAAIGTKLKAGERFGLIRFGSRTDVYLPQGIAICVVVGQRAVGGETVLADCQSVEKQREGEVR